MCLESLANLRRGLCPALLHIQLVVNPDKAALSIRTGWHTFLDVEEQMFPVVDVA